MARVALSVVSTHGRDCGKQALLAAGRPKKKRLAATRDRRLRSPSAMILVDLPSEAIMLIARFTSHPCAEIMQGCYCGETWFDWLERFEHRRQQNYLLAIEEEYAREEEREAKRARLDPLAMLRAEWEAEAAKYGYYDSDSD